MTNTMKTPDCANARRAPGLFRAEPQPSSTQKHLNQSTFPINHLFPAICSGPKFVSGATGVTPAMDSKTVGMGSQYMAAFVDSNGNAQDGGKNYTLHLPPNIPVKDFWSVILYDNQTRSMLQTDQRWPAATSQNPDLKANADGSVDVYFGPAAPAGKESNWIQTVPGKGWNTLLRLYGPLQPWFDKTWRPGEIEVVK